METGTEIPYGGNQHFYGGFLPCKVGQIYGVGGR